MFLENSCVFHQLKLVLASLFLLFHSAENLNSQSKAILDNESKEIQQAFESESWEILIKKAKSFNKKIERIKLKETDSSIIITSLDVNYKLAIAYTWMHHHDSAKQVLENYGLKKGLFPKHKDYFDYYTRSAQKKMQFINNQLANPEDDFYSIFEFTNKSLSHNNNIYFNSVINLCISYIYKHKHKQAVSLLYKALFHFDEVGAPKEYTAKVYYYLYLVYYTDANYFMALENAKKCIKIINSEKIDNEVISANATLASGISYFHLRQFHQSKELLHKSLNKLLKLKVENASIILNYNYLGQVYFAINQDNLPIEYKQKAIKLLEKKYQAKNHFLVSQMAYSHVIYIEKRINKLLKGLTVDGYESLTDFEYVFTHLPLNFNNMHPAHKIYYYSQQALTFARINDFEEAIDFLKKGLYVKNEYLPENHIKLEPYYKLIANCYLENSQYDSAIYYYEKAIKIYSLNNSGEFDLKIEYFKTNPDLLDLFKSLGDCFKRKALIISPEKRQAILLKALNCYIQSDNLAKEVNQRLYSDEDKLLLSKFMSKVYDSGIEICFVLKELSNDDKEIEHYAKQAFIFSQKSKTNLLEELVLKLNLEGILGLPEKLSRTEKELKNKIDYWERVISQRTEIDENETYHPIIKYRKSIDLESFNKTRASDSLFKYMAIRDSLINRYRDEYPRYYELKYANNVRTIEDIQAHLDEKSLVIDYHLSKESLEIFLISKNRFSSYQVKTKEPLEDYIEEYRHSISGYYKSKDFINEGLEQFLNNGELLYDYLIEPIEDEIKSKDKLIIIVSEALSLLPFETLANVDDEANKTDLASLPYLLKKHDIVYNYSCDLWLNSIQRTISNEKGEENLLGMAPVFDPQKMQSFSFGFNEDGTKMNAKAEPLLTELPATKKAIEEVCELAEKRGIKTEKYLYYDANKKKFIEALENKKYVLVATHGKADYTNPKFSGLYFAPADSSSNHTSFLYSEEAYNVHMASDLLVLYACETGTGKVSRGEGAMSLSRGFIASGSANVVHTLWSIQDVSTKDLVVNMFKSIFNKNSYSNSLRKAKLEMIEYGIIPFHWAGLVLVGN